MNSTAGRDEQQDEPDETERHQAVRAPQPPRQRQETGERRRCWRSRAATSKLSMSGTAWKIDCPRGTRKRARYRQNDFDLRPARSASPRRAGRETRSASARRSARCRRSASPPASAIPGAGNAGAARPGRPPARTSHRRAARPAASRPFPWRALPAIHEADAGHPPALPAAEHPAPARQESEQEEKREQHFGPAGDVADRLGHHRVHGEHRGRGESDRRRRAPPAHALCTACRLRSSAASSATQKTSITLMACSTTLVT